MLTFKDLQSRVLVWIDESDSTAAHTTQVVKDAINAAHRRLLLSRSWPFLLWPKEESLTTVAGQRTYALNAAMGKLLYVWDTQQQFYAPLIPRTSWENLGINRTTSGVQPEGWSQGPVWPVAVQPSASVVKIASSNGADTAVSVQLTGLDSTDVLVTETVTANGATAIASTTTWNHLLNVTKKGTWVGTLTLTNAAAATLLTLLPAEVGKQYPTLEATSVPYAGLVYTYRFSRPPDALVNDTDIPNIWPNDCAEILVYDTLRDLTTYNTDLGIKEQVAWKARFDELYAQLLDASSDALVGAYPRVVRDLDGGGYRGIRTG